MRSLWWTPLALTVACSRPPAPGDDCELCAGDVGAAQAAGGAPEQASSALFDTSDFPPRWYCGTWSDVHGWVHIFADVATWLAYMAIPTMLLLIIRKRSDIPFPGLLALFGAFIICCGATHLLEAVMFWWPAYRFMGLVKVLTAVISVITAVVLVFELPKFFQMRSPKQLEDEVSRRTAELEQARVAAQAAAEARARFTANVSHELRTPMAAILGFAELLDHDTRLAPEHRDRLGVIRRNGEHLISVINDVLDLSRSDAGMMPIASEPTDVQLLLSDAVEMFAAQARGKGLQLLRSLPAERTTLVVDPKRLRQIVINLVGNAIKFTDRGEVEVRAEVLAGANPESARLRLDVRDSGIGMRDAQAAKVFDEYAQADDTMSRRFGGSGLGLTISKRFADAMAGELSVLRSAPGEGTTMRLELELQRAAPATAARPSGAAAAALPRLDARRILVVDDAPDNRTLLQTVLTASGAEVDCAEDGQLALDMLGAVGGSPFDLVLMDLQMPRVDGLEATRRLRAGGDRTPILALTANASDEDRAASLAAGCDGHLSKPIRRAALLQAVAAALSDPG